MNWQQRHQQLDVPLVELLRERLERYQLSPTHLTHFLDLQYGGPQSFLLGTILRFPSAPTVDTCFGNVIHATLEWVQLQLNSKGKMPSLQATCKHAEQLLANEQLTEAQRAVQIDRARHALTSYLQKHATDFQSGNQPEKSFHDEGVFIGPVHMGGKVDLLEINPTAKTITVVDYKTGKLGSDPAKLHRYTLQLYCYKLLVEGSHSYTGYTVDRGRLVFVEPNENDDSTEKIIHFEVDEISRTKQLLNAMWQRVISLDMPDVSAYGTSYTDIRHFEDHLIDSSNSPK
jgi:RecB family exonuclease